MIVTDAPLPDAPWIKRAHTKEKITTLFLAQLLVSLLLVSLQKKRASCSFQKEKVTERF